MIVVSAAATRLAMEMIPIGSVDLSEARRIDASPFEGAGEMTLTRGRLVGHEFDRMVVLFSMVDGQKGNTLRHLDLRHRTGARPNSSGYAAKLQSALIANSW